MITAQKTRNPKTNSFTSILDQILNKYNLSTESNPLQLRAYANELGTMLPDWKAHKDVKETFRQCLFKENQIETLVPDKRGKNLTVKERVRYCAKTEDVSDIWLHALDLAVPKNNTDKAIVAASFCLSQFRKKLAEAGVDSEQINTYAKLPDITQAFNQRLQNIHTTETPTLQNLVDVIMMLSMRPAEATTLRIIYYKPDESNPPEWYNSDYSWYCTGKLLTWIQNAIAIGKLHDPVYSINEKRSTGIFSKFLKPYGITAKRLRKIRGKHASRVHGGQNPTSQHLTFLSRIAMRHRMDRHDPGMYYAEGDTSDSDLDSDLKPEPETQAFITKPIDKKTFTSEIKDIYDLYGNI
ncbi:hypothetical protein G9A89_008449 [Geosiphon pyriformis]|nr:hypothetical protein G9A89_008449 [Geosiphon pyriformis]